MHTLRHVRQALCAMRSTFVKDGGELGLRGQEITRVATKHECLKRLAKAVAALDARFHLGFVGCGKDLSVARWQEPAIA